MPAVASPTLDEVLSSLRTMFPSATIDADRSLGDLEIDSMDLLEWLYALVEDHAVEVDEAALQSIDDETTLRELYGSVFAA